MWRFSDNFPCSVHHEVEDIMTEFETSQLVAFYFLCAKFGTISKKTEFICDLSLLFGHPIRGASIEIL